jgi:type IV secretion system protein TrbF
MMKPYKKEIVEKKPEAPLTPYQLAKREWDERIGTSRMQARNWRFVAILSLLVTIFLAVTLFTLMPMLKKAKVLVVEVTKEGQVINITPLRSAYQPTLAQKEYFVSNFVKLIRDLSLDPVMAKKNWLNAYHFLTPRGAVLLNEYFRQNNPINLLGKQTVTVEIVDINPISETTFNVGWTENYVDINGQALAKKKISGVFTILIEEPKSQAEILVNPLGIYILDFHISERI